MKPLLLIIALLVGSLSVSYSQDCNSLWVLRAGAEQGDAIAQNELGRMYFEGKGVLQEAVLAYMWFSIAATNGNTLATENIDFIAMVMTSEDIAKAQQMARECVEKNYKGC